MKSVWLCVAQGPAQPKSRAVMRERPSGIELSPAFGSSGSSLPPGSNGRPSTYGCRTVRVWDRFTKGSASEISGIVLPLLVMPRVEFELSSSLADLEF